MATYTVTRVMTRPDITVSWPWEICGDITVSTETRDSISKEHSEDMLTLTQVVVWKDKDQYDAVLADSDVAAKLVEWRNYMAENGITSTYTLDDGTVKVFNSSSRTFEVE